MPIAPLDLTLPSSLAAIEDCAAAVAAWLARAGAAAIAQDVELAVHEAVCNAVVHGHGLQDILHITQWITVFEVFDNETEAVQRFA